MALGTATFHAWADEVSKGTLSLYSVSDASDKFCKVSGLDVPEFASVADVPHEGKYGSNIYPVTWGERVYMTSCMQGATAENFFTITDNQLVQVAQASLGVDNPGHHVLPLTDDGGFVSSFRHLYQYAVNDAEVTLTEVADGAFGHLVVFDGKLFVPYAESPSNSYSYAQMKSVKVYDVEHLDEVQTIDCAALIDDGYAINKAVLALDGKIYLGVLACDYSHYSDPQASYMLRLDPADMSVSRIDFPEGISGNITNIMSFDAAPLIASTVTPALYWVGGVTEGWSVDYHIYRYNLVTGETDMIVDRWEGANDGCAIYKGSFIESPESGVLYQGVGNYYNAKLYSWNPQAPEETTMYPEVKSLGGSIAFCFDRYVAPSSIAMPVKAEMRPNDTMELTATLNEDANVTGIIWTSSNPEVAWVDMTGKVSAVGEGEAVVTATSIANPRLTATCRVSVGKTVTMSRGEQSVTIEGDGWNLRNLPYNENEGKMGYESDVRNWHTVKLYPATEGNKVQVNISKLNLCGYDMNAMSPSMVEHLKDWQTKFYIYNGAADIEFKNFYTGVIDYENSHFDDCLYEWQYDNNRAEEGEVYRSTADDGALTIMFWHGIWGYYNGDVQTDSEYGFTATVAEVAPTEMTAIGSKADRKATWVTSTPTATNVPVLDFVVKTDGALHAAALTGVTIDLKGHAENIQSLHLMSYGLDVKNSEGVEVATIASVDNAETCTFVPEQLLLQDGRNRFAVLADLRDDLPDLSDATIKLASVTTDDVNLAVDNGDPEASVVVRTWYWFAEGTNEVLIGTNPILFSDSKGLDANYDTTAGSVTFVPRMADAKIRMTIDERPDLAPSDNLLLYSGSGSVDDRLVETFKYNSKTSLFPYQYISESEDGCITFSFAPQSEAADKEQKAGWCILLEAVIADGIDDYLQTDINVCRPVDVYDLKGLLLRKNIRYADAFTALPAGIYIVNQGSVSRKIVVKSAE